MVLLRPPTGRRPGRRALPALGLAAALVLVPGTAWAEGDPALPGEVTGAPEGDRTAEADATRPTTPTSTAEEPPAFEFPPELVAALEELAAQAGISPACVTGVVDSVELVGTGIVGLPGELQVLVTDLGAAVQEAVDSQDPAPVQEFLERLAPSQEGEDAALSVGEDIAAGLQQLADTLASDACRPAPPAPPGGPPAGPQPAAAVPPPAPPAPPAPAQPVVYPGYAPTGADGDDGGLPLGAVGVALTATAAGAVWTGRRWRAAPDGR